MDLDHAGSPGRMLAAQSQGGLLRVGRFGRDDRRTTILGHDPLGALAAKPPEETTDRRPGQSQCYGDGAGSLTLLPEPEHGLTDWYGSGTWHGRTSQGH